jgi:hypothetical protein
MRSFCHVGVFVDVCEYIHNGPGVVVGRCFDFRFGCRKGLGSSFSVGVKQGLDDDRDSAFEKGGLIVNQVGEAVLIQCGVDLLDDGAFDEVACLEKERVRQRRVAWRLGFGVMSWMLNQEAEVGVGGQKQLRGRRDCK